MATPPDFVAGNVLTAAQMNLIGLWETKTQTTGATGITLLDVTSCFNADFEAYYVTFIGLTNGTGTGHALQLLSGSTPAATSYYWTGTVQNSSSAVVSGENLGNTASMGIGEQGNAVSSFYTQIFIQSPFEARPTRFVSNMSVFVGGPIGYNWNRQGLHNQSVSYDGFRYLTTGAPTFNTVTCRVYGYRE